MREFDLIASAPLVTHSQQSILSEYSQMCDLHAEGFSLVRPRHVISSASHGFGTIARVSPPVVLPSYVALAWRGVFHVVGGFVPHVS